MEKKNAVRLYDYISENVEQETPAEIPEPETEFTKDVVTIRFRPQALSKYRNLLFLLYRLGYIYHTDKTFLPGARINRLVYIKLNHDPPNRENHLKVRLAEVCTEGKLTSAEISIEIRNDKSLKFISRCMSLTKINLNDIKSKPEGYENKTEQTNKLFLTGNEGQGSPEINQAIKHLKHKKIWIKN